MRDDMESSKVADATEELLEKRVVMPNNLITRKNLSNALCLDWWSFLGHWNLCKILATPIIDPMWLIDIRELCACWILGSSFAFDRKNLTACH